MKWDKKGEEGTFGWSTIVTWAIIIAIGVTVIIIMVKSTDIGQTAWSRVKDLFTFA